MDEKITENKKEYFLGISILISTFIIAGAWVYTAKFEILTGPGRLNDQQLAELQSKIIPEGGVVLPVHWDDLGVKMVSAGVIDKEKLESLYAGRGGLDDEAKNLLYGGSNGNLKITSENSGTILNLFWALGLGNKNDILEKGPMMDLRYGGVENFASTGGWTLGQGGSSTGLGASAMVHYSRHQFFSLTKEQQELVERVSKNIYRPCCNNPTHFPDCNHGMAMLGLLELMVSQGVSEKEMYRAALQANTYWFPDTYFTIAQYLKLKGVEWNKADPKELLSYNFSSASGYQQILSQVAPSGQKSGGSCGV